MKILILSDDFPPQSFGGAGYSTFYLASGLQKAGHQVFVITTCRQKTDKDWTNYQGLRIFRISANYHERYRAYFSLYNPWTVSRVREIIKEINPDVVHANNIHFYLSYHCLKIAKKMGKPVFLTARDAMLFSYGKLVTKRYSEQLNPHISWWDNLRQAKKRYNPLRNLIIKRYLKYVDRIIAVSHEIKNALNQNGIENVEVHHTGIDVSEWQINPQIVEDFKNKHRLQGKKVVFFGGRISGLKGVNQVNQAMLKVRREIPQTVLLIVGQGGIGWLTGEELKGAYGASDMLVVPSLYLDPFPRSNLEAMACQKPIIGSQYGGTKEAVQDGVTGFIVNPFNINQMAEKIIDLLKNPQKARQFGQAGFERAKTYFALDNYINQTISCYKKFL